MQIGGGSKRKIRGSDFYTAHRQRHTQHAASTLCSIRLLRKSQQTLSTTDIGSRSNQNGCFCFRQKCSCVTKVLVVEFRDFGDFGGGEGWVAGGSWQQKCYCYGCTSCVFQANFCNVAAGAALAAVSPNRFLELLTFPASGSRCFYGEDPKVL